MFDSTLKPGFHVTPNIRLVRLLGQGGMGTVWVADHLGLRTQVVVKFVAGAHAETPEVRERFEREAALAAQAKSPHVVQVLDHGTTPSGVPYIAMELLEGEDLGQRIAREGPIPPNLFADWLTQACKGLGRAHSKGIIHRDIKPENIFLCDVDGEIVVKVLDFGIAKDAAGAGFAATKSGAFLGTAYYMSPEQTMAAKNIDLRTDLWSLGVTAYLALTGVRPFELDSIGAIVTAILSGPITPPSTYQPALGPHVDAWMAKALARPPDQRFASAKDLAQAFTVAAALAQSPLASTAFMTPSSPALQAHATSVIPGPGAQVAPLSTNVGLARSSPQQTSGPPKLVVAAIGLVAAVAVAIGGTALVYRSRATPSRVALDATSQPPLAAVASGAVPSGTATGSSETDPRPAPSDSPTAGAIRSAGAQPRTGPSARVGGIARSEPSATSSSAVMIVAPSAEPRDVKKPAAASMTDDKPYAPPPKPAPLRADDPWKTSPP
jgi:serine/threonine-protein kinase